jgi:hypothetical protein
MPDLESSLARKALAEDDDNEFVPGYSDLRNGDQADTAIAVAKLVADPAPAALTPAGKAAPGADEPREPTPPTHKSAPPVFKDIETPHTLQGWADLSAQGELECMPNTQLQMRSSGTRTRNPAARLAHAGQEIDSSHPACRYCEGFRMIGHDIAVGVGPNGHAGIVKRVAEHSTATLAANAERMQDKYRKKRRFCKCPACVA